MEYKCKHHQETDHKYGLCVLHNVHPSTDACAVCPDNTSKDIGLGDVVSSVIKTVTLGKVKECGGCKKRKELLNKIKLKKTV